MNPALAPKEWRALLLPRDRWDGTMLEVTEDVSRAIKDDTDEVVLFSTADWREPHDPHGMAAALLHDQPYGFTQDMVEAIYTLLWFSGGSGYCQRCLAEREDGGKMEGGTGIVGNPKCVVTCSVCGWFPREVPSIRSRAADAVCAIVALLPPRGETQITTGEELET